MTTFHGPLPSNPTSLFAHIQSAFESGWPAWGPCLFEGDVDLDIAASIDDDAGFPVSAWGLDKNEQLDIPETARKLNAGTFTRLFDKYKAAGPSYEGFGAKFFTVILVALGMQAGAEISKEQLDYARSISYSAGLYREGIRQFEEALKRYKAGVPYDFKEISVVDMANEPLSTLSSSSGPGSELRLERKRDCS